jgi:outer membrane protein TolC
MMRIHFMARFTLLVFLSCLSSALASNAQTLSLKDALQKALANYGTIKAKANYAHASQATVDQARRDYLPNLAVSAQQDYGTVNGQNGPLYGFGGLGVASSGAALPDQNWNAAFGALYLANVNWEFFAFGRAKERVRVAQSAAYRDESDLKQEQFQQQVRVAAAYLNLLAAQRLYRSQQNNLDRASALQNVVVVKAKNGLIAGVDSSQANAEISAARIALTRARDAVQEQANQLAQLMGVPPSDFELDSFFIAKIPAGLVREDNYNLSRHPLLQYYQNRIQLSDEQKRYYKTLAYPSLSLFGVIQTRGSGFSTGYTLDQAGYSQDYVTGVSPTRTNYLFGIGLSWNLTSILRTQKQVQAQRYVSAGLQDEYELVDQRLKAQLSLADSKIENALSNYHEAPLQVKAASDAYLQKSVLYKNGLTNIVDVTQTLYMLNRAETDRDIAYSNVWQALLLKAAAAGDFSIFNNEL